MYLSSDIAGVIAGHLELIDILRCRLVCSGWYNCFRVPPLQIMYKHNGDILCACRHELSIHFVGKFIVSNLQDHHISGWCVNICAPSSLVIPRFPTIIVDFSDGCIFTRQLRLVFGKVLYGLPVYIGERGTCRGCTHVYELQGVPLEECAIVSEDWGLVFIRGDSCKSPSPHITKSRAGAIELYNKFMLV